MSKLKYYDGTKWITVNGQITGDTLPIGSIVPYGSTNAPVNWLVCDGRAVSRTTYADLFNIIGTSFGSGDGSTTFNLPNLKGRVAVGQDTTQTEFDTIGEIGGSKYLQAHNHNFIVGNIYYQTGGTNAIVPVNPPGAGSIETSTTGTGDSGNLQPYQVVCYIIKVSQSSGLIANVSNTQSNSQTDTYSCDYIEDNFELKGTVLYNNPNGSSDNITLSDSASNYSCIEIFYEGAYNYNSARIFNPNGKSAYLFAGWFNNNSSGNIKIANVNISGTSITKINYTALNYSSQNAYATEENAILIRKVVGYK